MNTQIEGRKVQINKPQTEVYTFLSEPGNFKSIMPEDVKRFEAGEDWFLFELKGIPAVKMKVAELTPNEQIRLTSASDKFNFELVGHFNDVNGGTEAQLVFQGDFNPMLKMMVTKPLTNFINVLTDQLEKL